jgi:hypothetical protein
MPTLKVNAKSTVDQAQKQVEASNRRAHSPGHQPFNLDPSKVHRTSKYKKAKVMSQSRAAVAR